VGIAIGVLIGSSGIVYSAMGKSGWDNQTPQFKAGYLAAFTDVVRMAKRTEPSGLIATSYTIPSKAKLVNWLYQVESTFAEEKNAERNITQIIAFAGAAMAREFGGDVTTASGMEQLAQVLKNRREAIARGDVKQTPPEVMARRNAIAARKKAFGKCMGSAHRETKTICKGKIKADFPPVPKLSYDDSATGKDE